MVAPAGHSGPLARSILQPAGFPIRNPTNSPAGNLPGSTAILRENNPDIGLKAGEEDSLARSGIRDRRGKVCRFPPFPLLKRGI